MDLKWINCELVWLKLESYPLHPSKHPSEPLTVWCRTWRASRTDRTSRADPPRHRRRRATSSFSTNCTWRHSLYVWAHDVTAFMFVHMTSQPLCLCTWRHSLYVCAHDVTAFMFVNMTSQPSCLCTWRHSFHVCAHDVTAFTFELIMS